MATRSYVAAETERGIIGVYVHWDGYPEGRLSVLRDLVARDGLATVVKTIVGKPNGWSHLSADPGNNELSIGMQDGRFGVVPGYGVEYTTVQGQARTEYWTPETNSAESWCEYVYIIRTNGTVDWAPIGCGDDIAEYDWATESLRAE
jgi:hypothetical protein